MKKWNVLFCMCCLSVLFCAQGQTVQNPVVIDSTRSALMLNDSLYSDDLSSLSEDPTLPKSSHTVTPSYLVSDDPIITALDSMGRQKYLETFSFTTDRNILNVYNYSMDEIPEFSDSVLEARLARLNLQTPMELDFNTHVKQYINIYANKKRALTSKMLGLAQIYFPMFEEMLDKYDVPLEMKYLAIVESALNPVATSRAGARGLWQFMYNTGKMYGLEVTSITDDRYDPYKSTDAACRHLKDLYNMYGNWELALAAYNCGPGNVNKAIRRAGGKTNYWQIWSYLPAETRGYVPAFIAVNYVMNYASEHNIYPVEPGIYAHKIDTVTVREVLSFGQVSEMLGVEQDLVQFLNPIYKKGIIPASPANTCILRLPNEYIGLYISNEDSLYAYKTKAGLEKERILAEMKEISKQEIKYHTVKKGETLLVIATKYKCTVPQLKEWNNLRTTNLKIGQRLTVYTASSGASRSSPLTSYTSSNTSNNTSKHTVIQGESLSIIAQKYGCSVDNLQKWNNLSGTNLSVGQVLQVRDPAKATTASTGSSSGSAITYYKVKEGDNLWNISQRYPGVSPDDIKKYNGLTNNNIKVGQTLKIPKKS